MQKNKSKSSPYHQHQNESSLMMEALANVMDIEDLVKEGKDKKTCSYYTSRKAIKYAQVVCMPYNFYVIS